MQGRILPHPEWYSYATSVANSCMLASTASSMLCCVCVISMYLYIQLTIYTALLPSATTAQQEIIIMHTIDRSSSHLCS